MAQKKAKRILAVDDEPTNLRLLEAVLIPQGYILAMASNGQEALDKIKLIAPDLVLLDVMMPDMDGYQVCKKIRGNAMLPYVPIIFVTAIKTDQSEIIQGLDIGGDDYIRKPFDTPELLSRIRAALRVKELTDELSRVKAELSRYVSLSTVEMVEKTTSGENIPEGETRNVTVLFSDIRGFTTFSQDMHPSEVFAMLNLYLSRQIELVEGHGGIVDKLTGDEVMAVFEGPEMGANALRCGINIVKTLCDAKSCQGADWIGVGIGINTGPVYVGSIGSETLKDYTVVGNTVNVAARLCGFAKKFQVVFTQATRNLIEETSLQYHSVGKSPLKGISAPIEMFQLKIDN